MINVFVGKPGTGKTYSLVRTALQAIKMGRDVYSNFYINFDTLNLTPKKNKPLGRLLFWKDIEEFVDIKSGEILMDEAQIYLNSRDWKTLPRSLQYKLQQHRKHGINIWGAVQNVKRIDTVARELVNSVFQVRRMGRIFIVNEYDIEEIDKVKRHSYSTHIFFLNMILANCFDTLQEIALSDIKKNVRENQVTKSHPDFPPRNFDGNLLPQSFWADSKN